MTTRIVYDTEFIDDGVTITPLSIAMRRDDGAALYAVSDNLAVMARAAENAWLRENVLRWLPITLDFTMANERLNAHVQWNDEHPDYGAIRTLDEIAEMVEDFVLAKPDPQLWAYYAAYDHVLYAQLFGAMIDLPPGMPMFTMDLRHEAVMRNVTALPELAQGIVNQTYRGERMAHHAMFDAHEEEYRLNWLLSQHRLSFLIPD